MRFDEITLCFDMYGCPNRCKHCWLGIMKNTPINKADVEKYVYHFKKYTDSLRVYSWLREPDYSDNYKDLYKFEQKLSNLEPTKFELCSFYRVVRDNNYVKWLYDIGIRKCQLTLFGLEHITDKYVGRKGAFKEILRATDILIDNNIAPRWQMFVNRENINEIDKVITLIQELDLENRCKEINQEFKFFIHQGSCDGENAKLYDIRITKDDLQNIPNKYTIDLGVTEKELYSELLNDNTTLSLVSNKPVFFISNNLDVFPNYTELSKFWKLGNLKTDGIDNIVSNYVNNRSTAQNVRRNIPLSKLVQQCGNPNSERLFDKDDYIIFLLNKYCKEL